jgi:RNA polymerase sigma-70 factor (ECF subfamily)
MTFEQIYETHFDLVWRLLRRFGVSESDAPDAAQEVFLVVHRKLPEFEQRSKVSTWLYGICLRVAADRRRRPEARIQKSSDDELIDVPDDKNDAYDDLVRRQGLEQLDRILDTMTFEQRTVFVLFEIEECEGDEIAGLLQVPIGTVRSRLRLAREAFRIGVERAQARARYQRVGSLEENR